LEKRDLVIKFLNNECTAEEAKEAMQIIDENPGMLDELAPKSEWDADHITTIPHYIEKEIRGHVAAAGRKGKVLAIFKRVAVAAAVLAFIISAFLLMQPAQKREASVAVYEPVAAPAFDTVINRGNDVHQILLADGSSIRLHANSSVIYSTGFKDKREIYLAGKAVFYVAKNPNAPFIVHSGAITTTALGTTFLVDAGKEATAINVQLYEGKVVVKSVDVNLSIADTYLMPGEQCNVNVALALVKVSKIPELQSRNNNRGMLAVKIKDNEAEQLALDFEKVPLASTFERLQKVFNKEIVFEGNENTQNLFTGHFDKSDSLQQILQIIAVMNGLQVEQVGNKFRLSQKPAMANTAPVKISQEARVSASSGSTPVPVSMPPTIPPAVMDSNLKADHADSNSMQIVVVPAGKEYRKVTLSMVFDQIAKANNINIKYQQEQLQGLYFTGTIPNDNSSIEMLQIICRMNGLKLSKKKGGEYTVQSKKQ
jgi:transmembrane sensor